MYGWNTRSGFVQLGYGFDVEVCGQVTVTYGKVIGDTPINFSAIYYYYIKTTRHRSAHTSGNDNKPDNTLSNFSPG